MKEIEKKYLVKELPNLENVPFIDIEQSYLNTNPDPVLRVRKYGEEYFLTYKSKISNDKNLNIANEYELPLQKEVYEKLQTKVESKLVKKRRYKINLENDLIAELDIYDDYLKGFMNVEVEFKTEEDYETFTEPDWFGKDVTNDKRYSNSSLSKLDNIESLMEE